jgi:hypothetical protein
MDLDIVLNELSIKAGAEDIQTARLWMSNLILTIKTAVRAGARRVLRSCLDLNSTFLSADYPIARWRNDSNVDLELRRYFRVLTTRYPALKDLPELDNGIPLIDFYLMGESALGLGIAFLLESLSVSFMSEPRWNRTKIEEIEMLFLQGDGILIAEKVSVYHASLPKHIEQNLDWIRNRLRRAIRSGEHLWNRRQELFPHLAFCEDIGKVIVPLFPGDPMLKQIARRLFEIDQCCRGWVGGTFDTNTLPFKVTGEHEATLKKYGKERTFVCPGEGEIIFKLHGRITPGAWRIYFEPVTSSRRMCIGYVGPKLPSVDYPT